MEKYNINIITIFLIVLVAITLIYILFDLIKNKAKARNILALIAFTTLSILTISNTFYNSELYFIFISQGNGYRE